jgi:hypothetical protein
LSVIAEMSHLIVDDRTKPALAVFGNQAESEAQWQMGQAASIL